MATPDQWKRRLLIAEILSLLTLVASLLALRHDAPGQSPINAYWLLLPALASLTMFLSFLGLMYLRWLASAVTASRRWIQQVLFAVMALTLLSIWALAITQTWHSLDRAVDGPAKDLRQKS